MKTDGPLRSECAPHACRNCPVRIHAIYSAAQDSEIVEIERLRSGYRRMPARSLIMQEGNSDEVFTLREGWAYRFRVLPDGRRQILSFLLPGDIVGLHALRARPINYSVRALTDDTICYFETRKFSQFLRSRPELKETLIRSCAMEVEQLEERLIDLGRRTALERLARLVIELEQRLCARDAVAGNVFPFPLKQEHIADALGLTPVHVSRTVGKLRALGLIALSGGKMTIHDPEGLSALASGRSIGTATA